MPRWLLRLFGGFELTAVPGGERVTTLGKRERVLLSYLALSPNGRQQRRKLATLLWGDATDATLLDNLRTSIWSLRKVLGDADHRLIASEGEEIALDVAAFDIDALSFRRLAAQSVRADLEAAAALCTGPFLEGLDIDSEDFESWRREEAARFRDQTIDVLNRLMTQLADSGETERAIETAKRLMRLEPLHEAAARRLMRLYTETDRRGAAIEVYRALSETLRSELNAQPKPETRAVFAELSGGSEEQTGVPRADALPPPSASEPRRQPAPAASDVPSLSTPAAAVRPRDEAPAPRADTQGDRWRPLARSKWPLAGGLAAALIAALLLYQFAPPSGTTAQSGADGAKEGASSEAGISIAVLPFANLSGDASQEFFSDGMTEEITSALARVPTLRLVGRSSAFQFKGQNRDLRAIGQALNATHLIEGSVRKEGDRVRITAQLVKADDGLNVWIESYDRQLTSVFATQEDIAEAIATSLSVPLGLKQGESLVRNRTTDLSSYDQYLRARAIVRGRGRGGETRLSDASALLEQVIAHDPNYAPAWAMLALAYAVAPNFDPAFPNLSAVELRRMVDATLPRAEEAARRAIQLDANLADGYLSLARVLDARGKPLLADHYFSKALALDPYNPDALSLYSNVLAGVGRLREALAMKQRGLALEPFVPIYQRNTGLLLWLSGHDAAAIAMVNTVPPGGAGRDTLLAEIHAAARQYGEAANALQRMPGTAFAPGVLDAATRLLRNAPVPAASPQDLPPFVAGLEFVYLHVGAFDRVLEKFERNVEGGYMLAVYIAALWHPSYAPVRKTERFKVLMRNAGMVEYWRAKGWPDLCRPIGADDFTCS